MITAYPFGFSLGPIFGIGPLHVTGFGIMMMLAFLVGGWLIDRECRRNEFASDYVGDIFMGAVIGGIVGAKVWFAALHGVATLLDRAGLVFYGGLVGGTIGVVLNGWRRRVPMRWTAQLVAPALAAAYAVGRVGCYVVGDDYGIPTTLPWGVRFPQGMPPTTAESLREFHVAVPATAAPNTIFAVHPTQLYEIAAMLVVFALIWRWRTLPRGTGWLFGAYMVLAGVERFAVEILRAKDDRLLGAFSVAQVASVVMVIVGVAVIVELSSRPRTAPGEWLVSGSRGRAGGARAST
ncbi:MAG: prolipoprotein diacylglyceryl transferase [Gemmatimonadales bacterium]